MYNVGPEYVSSDYTTAYPSFDEFISNMQISILSRTESKIVFDLKNTHPSIANALRRILISEIPTFAIHDIAIRENDTIFPDEYIAHRLGLIPLNVNPDELEYSYASNTTKNTLNFCLSVKNETREMLVLYSNQIVWVPQEGQQHLHVQLQPDVMICKLAPGNFLNIEITAMKGIGASHAKWSPVSLCSYRLMPKITLERDFHDEDAKELQRCFSKGVIEIIDGKAVVSNPRLELMSREVLRHEKFKNFVKINRESGWFCFTVETVALDPLYLVRKAISVFAEKCRSLREELLPRCGD
ncbi:DNA-directed RNA polymerases I and III subunit RPAC1 [Pancytospora epiphaga]|nr:DNA-directed RNA polymerases I and III subunit RPAC1 [Pancytospora epiphaga]